jgi:trehalose/maltose hydrolase-like predicted phosphorylase
MTFDSFYNSDKNWTLDYYEYSPEKERQREALCTIGNGFFSSRGNIEGLNNPEISYPATYISGVYNKLSSYIHEKNIINEDLVRCPDFMSVKFKISNGEWLDISQVEILEYHQQLNFKNSTLCRYILFQDHKKRITSVVSKRLISMNSKNINALEYTITPENYSAEISFKSILNGDIKNEGVKRYEDFSSKHLQTLDSGELDDVIFLTVKTIESNIIITGASKIFLQLNNKPIQPHFYYKQNNYSIEQQFSTFVSEKRSFKVEKISSIQLSRVSDGDIHTKVISSISSVNGWSEVYSPHAKAWEKLWNQVDIEVEGDNYTQRSIRLNMHHILITASIHNRKDDTSLPARGLTGEAYRGHIFWDELFILPFYIMHFPQIAKSILMYRYRRLDRAREIAFSNGLRGALFPWQSEHDGSEGSQEIHLNPVSGLWEKDKSSLQSHISSAIAYNVWAYYQATLDVEFLELYGAEIIFEVTLFWSSKAIFNNVSKKYEIDNVMGPDEFHEVYPESPDIGLQNNAYTNILAVWIMMKALDLLYVLSDTRLSELKKQLQIDDMEIKRWHKISNNMHLSINEEGIVSQFDGFLGLKELPWEEYRNKYQNITRMDRILKAEGKSPNHYQILKQADFLMIFYLFSFEDIKEILTRLGYKITEGFLRNNYDYYLSRTTHGSTLSAVVHAYISCIVGEKEKCLSFFIQALRADIDDIQCGTTEEGIHLGMMGGTIHVLLSIFAGIEVRKNIIRINPHLPDKWKRLKFNYLFRDNCYHIEIFRKRIMIHVTEKNNNENTKIIEIQGSQYILNSNDSLSVSISDDGL